MKEQIPANVMNDTNIYTLEGSNTGVDWLNNFSTPHFELVERTTEVNGLTFRLGMLAVALGAIPVGQYDLHDINNERYEIRRSVDNMDLQLPTEYIVHTESQIDEAQEWVTDEKERKIQELEEISNLPNRANLALATTVTGWLSLIAMNSVAYFQKKDKAQS